MGIFTAFKTFHTLIGRQIGCHGAPQIKRNPIKQLFVALLVLLLNGIKSLTLNGMDALLLRAEGSCRDACKLRKLWLDKYKKVSAHSPHSISLKIKRSPANTAAIASNFTLPCLFSWAVPHPSITKQFRHRRSDLAESRTAPHAGS